ncbi:MBL fold metallo-hydrolase [Amnibacterium kyonggiense]|uniref:Glyoxylase-like metal-dependent hydrolase (Beta-lactamase superfamily II) n=1 Tax=Amnibacterium kyonggiense TaxID=595671 RepID=A0A4R7FMT6_9MICO|nr:MBL fold metallo-hydrolase [Amnibacterium kyonggiense]TDS77649.1 glyoxylase-like metal-dependent hydrolase (beta-lactamase superfamily II) [Amnibacterium kyonggiense]
MASPITVTPWTADLPPARPPAGVRLFHLPTGSYDTRGAFAVAGGSFREQRVFAASAVLVQHPAGDLLIDAGFGADLSEHVGMLARMERAPHRRATTAAEQLRAAGYETGRLLGVLVTHVHWDHVSGLDSLRVPVWINADELRYGREDPHGAVFRHVSAGLPVHEYAFDGPAHLGFPASHDVFGDGSVVIAQAGGHTSGSVVVFVTPASGERFAFIGDLTWQMDGITRRVERSWLMRKLADVDPRLVRENLSRVIALRDRLRIVPSHDLAAYDAIPLLASTFPTPADPR